MRLPHGKQTICVHPLPAMKRLKMQVTVLTVLTCFQFEAPWSRILFNVTHLCKQCSVRIVPDYGKATDGRLGRWNLFSQYAD